ncbi:MAG: hypothetical protein HY554_00795 [Elusimicrobia bacterium]|nr:hypothetical protein [Elusimicrobiota bacterium]
MLRLLLLLALLPADAAGPDWRARFESAWEAKGRRQALKPWLRKRRIVVLDSGLEEAALVRRSLREQLAELGSRSIAVELAAPAQPDPLRRCIKGEVLDTSCVGRAVKLMRAEPAYAGSIVVLVTDAALDLLPKPQPDGSTLGPPAGKASHDEGWAVISEFYRRRARSEGREDAKGPGGATFLGHGREHTARHELGHLLGLAHHEALANPGFPEAKACERHQGLHRDCLMSCGAGDDEWFHLAATGAGFGLCPKCAAAARAFLAGLERAPAL